MSELLDNSGEMLRSRGVDPEPLQGDAITAMAVAVVLDRGEITAEQVNAYLAGGPDPYMDHLAFAIDGIEEAIRESI